MSVTGCELVRGIQGGSFGLMGDDNVSLKYKITTDSDLMLPYSVKSQSTRGTSTLPGPGTTNDLVPALYDQYNFATGNAFGNRSFGASEKNLSIFATRIAVEQNKDKLKQWFAIATYSKLPAKSLPTDSIADPLARPATYWFEFGTETEEITEAYNVDEIGSETGLATPFYRAVNDFGPIVNAAGEDYDTAIYRDKKTVTVVVAKNFNTDLWAIQLNNIYDRTINDAAMFAGTDWEVPLHCAKFDGAITSKALYENDITYYQVEIRVRLQREPYYHHIVNRGMKYWTSSVIGATLINAQDETPPPKGPKDTGEPALLTINGTKLGSALGNTIAYRDLEEADYTLLENYITNP